MYLDIPRYARHYDADKPSRRCLCPLDEGKPALAVDGECLALACSHGYLGLYSFEREPCDPSVMYYVR
jgi:hypothetical protein